MAYSLLQSTIRLLLISVWFVQTSSLTLSMLGNFSCFFFFICRYFLKINVLIQIRSEHSVGPGLGPKLFTKIISRLQTLPLTGKELTFELLCIILVPLYRRVPSSTNGVAGFQHKFKGWFPIERSVSPG